jgi:hypothetical protein
MAFMKVRCPYCGNDLASQSTLTVRLSDLFAPHPVASCEKCGRHSVLEFRWSIFFAANIASFFAWSGLALIEYLRPSTITSIFAANVVSYCLSVVIASRYIVVARIPD